MDDQVFVCSAAGCDMEPHLRDANTGAIFCRQHSATVLYVGPEYIIRRQALLAAIPTPRATIPRRTSVWRSLRPLVWFIAAVVSVDLLLGVGVVIWLRVAKLCAGAE